MTPVLLDCSEFAVNPINTGIQRVVRELLRGWPTEARLFAPVRFVPGLGLCAIPEPALRLLTDSGGASHPDAATHLAAAVSAACAPSAPVQLDHHTIIIPEVFYDPARVAWHETLAARHDVTLGMLAYDFLPWTQPGLYPNPTVAPNMPYLRLLSRAHSVAAISERTRQAFATRIMRGRAAPDQVGPVLPLGADALRMPHQAWRADRRGFVCLGTLDVRKNQHLVAEAFIGLWNAGHDMPLTLCGRAMDGADLSWVEAARHYSQFTWKNDASDADVAVLMQAARATIYVSEVEGFGLPPVESLHAGVPVIVHEGLPSVADLPPAGQCRIGRVTPEAIASAVLMLSEDATCEALWAGAGDARTTTWAEFAGMAASWAGSLPAPNEGVRR